MANVLNRLPKAVQPRAKRDLQQIWMAPTREAARKAFDQFLTTYRAKYPQESLGTTDLGHRPSQCCQVEVPVRPVAGLPYVFVIAAIHTEIMSQILRMRKLFAALDAEKDGAIRRTADYRTPE